MQQLVNGLAVGSIYALIALGYTMVYGTIKLINFAHGDVYMMGAFIGYFAVMVLKMNVFVALLVAMVACAVLGVVIERVAYKPLRNSTRVAALITAIGVSYLLENAMSYFFGAESRPFPSDFGTETITLFGDVFSQRKTNFDFRSDRRLNGVITIYRSLYKNGESHACGCRG